MDISPKEILFFTINSCFLALIIFYEIEIAFLFSGLIGKVFRKLQLSILIFSTINCYLVTIPIISAFFNLSSIMTQTSVYLHFIFSLVSVVVGFMLLDEIKKNQMLIKGVLNKAYVIGRFGVFMMSMAVFILYFSFFISGSLINDKYYLGYIWFIPNIFGYLFCIISLKKVYGALS